MRVCAVPYLAEVLRSVVHEPERVFCERVKHVQAVDLVPLGDGEVEADQGQSVGLGDAQRGIQAGNEVGHLVEIDELGGVGVVPKKIIIKLST